MKKLFENIIIKVMMIRFNSKSYQKKLDNWLDNFDEWLESED